MTEKWVPLKGWEEYYRISNHGRIYSLPRTSTDGRQLNGRYLKLKLSEDGYDAQLTDGDRKIGTSLSRLMAINFLGLDPESKMVAAYVDGDFLNMHIDNITVCPQWMIIGRGWKKVKRILSNGTEEIYQSINQAMRATGVHQSTIIKCIQRNGKQKNGVKWEYIEDKE